MYNVMYNEKRENLDTHIYLQASIKLNYTKMK